MQQPSFLVITWITLVLAIKPHLALTVTPLQAAPDFTLSKIDGESMISLSDFKGKVIYVEFWASWSTSSRKSFSALNQIRDEFARADFEIIGIHVGESREDGLSFLEKNTADFPILHDENGETPERYNIKDMPYGFLINRQGKVVEVIARFRHTDKSVLQKKVLHLIGR